MGLRLFPFVLCVTILACIRGLHHENFAFRQTPIFCLLLPSPMHIDELDFPLPADLIADRPCEPREGCRLMVLHRASGKIEHRIFTELETFLRDGDLLVLNSAKVTPARMFAIIEEPSRRRFEVLAIDAGSSSRCRCLLNPSAYIKEGVWLRGCETGTRFKVLRKVGEGQWEVELEDVNSSWRTLLDSEGHIPLPPYILKQRAVQTDLPEDRQWYQTAYADRDGAIAAPTAGLHFSSEMLHRLEGRGVGRAQIFLKVGIGTFQPIRVSVLEEHVLQPEEYEISPEAAERVQNSKSSGKRVIAVGTTSLRTLEYVHLRHGAVIAGTGAADIFIKPPHEFRVADALITNFHLPKTTLLALVFAFAGRDLTLKAYEEAMQKRYRFFSYGDCMLIL